MVNKAGMAVIGYLLIGLHIPNISSAIAIMGANCQSGIGPFNPAYNSSACKALCHCDQIPDLEDYRLFFTSAASAYWNNLKHVSALHQHVCLYL